MVGSGLEPWEGIAPKGWLTRATIALATLGLALRLVRYLQNFPLWCDETMLAVNLLDRRWIELARPLDYHQVCPLGFLALAWAAVQSLGFSELSLRFVSIGCALASAPVFWLLARRFFGERTVGTLLAVGLFAVAQPPIRYAAEFKPYSCDLPVAATLLWLALCRWENPQRAARFLDFGGGRTAGHCVVVAVGVRDRRDCVDGSRGSAQNAATPSDALILGVLDDRQREFCRDGHTGAVSHDPERPSVLPQLLGSRLSAFAHGTIGINRLDTACHTGPLFAYPHGPGRFPEWVNALVFGSFLVGIRVRWRRDPQVVILLLSPFLLGLAAAWLRRYPYGMSPRVSQFLVPSTLLLMAAGMEDLIERTRPLSLRRLALPSIVGMLVALGACRFAVDLGRPYRSEGDRTAREFRAGSGKSSTPMPRRSAFARISAFPCVRSAGLMTASTSTSVINASILFAIIAACRRVDSVTMQRPLRCVMLNRLPQVVPGFMAWLHDNRNRYVLHDIQAYPAFRGTPDEPQLVSVVCNLLPVEANVAAGVGKETTR